MLAYRHAFHAGNHADVLKHLVLTLVLKYLNQKDKPYRLVDTHAGAGGYSLEGRYAQKKGEYEQGISRLWTRDDLPPPVADYVQMVRDFNPEGRFEQYPGSPAFARMLLRPTDQLRLFELHPTDYRILDSYLGKTRGVEIHNGDGFAGLKGQLPPSTRRGLVLMDPSYEGNGDYGKVVSALREALLRFVEGVYMIWYPQVTKVEAAELPRRLQALANSLEDSKGKGAGKGTGKGRGWLHVRLTVQELDSQGFGLAGSGVFILNPPFSLHDELLPLMPYLVESLGQYDGAHFLLEQKTV